MAQCTAKSKQSGAQCKRQAVAGGTKCTIHGGASLKGADSPSIHHGRYSRYLRDSLKEKLSDVQDDNPLDLLPELQMQRALFSEYVSRFQVGTPLGMGDIDALIGWSAEIGKSVERIVKMKNDEALTQAEVRFLALRVVELLGKYVVDPDQQRAFIAELLASVPALDVGNMG